MRGRVVHLKVRFDDFSTVTRSHTLDAATDITEELWQAADEMLCRRLPARHLAVRLLGMGVSGLDETGPTQGLLFDQEERRKQSGLDKVADQIRERFGSSALRRGAVIRREDGKD